MSERKITLYMREGSADKVYQLHLRPAGDLWIVERGNARRGQSLRMGLLTQVPVTLDRANDEFDKKVKEQMRKGYHEGEGASSYTSSEFAGRGSDHRQQLPTAISRERAEALLRDSAWGLQAKANGVRTTLEVTGDRLVRGINKLGLYVPVPEHWVEAFGVLAAEGGALIDGEQIGDELHAFDVLKLNINDLRDRPFDLRVQQLDRILAHHGAAMAAVLKPLKVFKTAEEKAAAARDIEANNGEGFVFKLLSAPYAPGRSDTVFKYKFTESSTCVVTARNAQRSVAIGLIDATGQLRPVGNVTIPPNHGIPEKGQLVEVQYLYLNPHGAFEQPVYLGTRDDVASDECHFGQVSRLKPGVVMPAELWAGAADHEDEQQPAERMRA